MQPRLPGARNLSGASIEKMRWCSQSASRKVHLRPTAATGGFGSFSMHRGFLRVHEPEWQPRQGEAGPTATQRRPCFLPRPRLRGLRKCGSNVQSLTPGMALTPEMCRTRRKRASLAGGRALDPAASPPAGAPLSRSRTTRSSSSTAGPAAPAPAVAARSRP